MFKLYGSLYGFYRRVSGVMYELQIFMHALKGTTQTIVHQSVRFVCYKMLSNRSTTTI